MAEKNHGITYTVIDDIKHEIREDILNGFGSDKQFKKMYNKKPDQEVTIDEIIIPNPKPNIAIKTISIGNNIILGEGEIEAPL